MVELLSFLWDMSFLLPIFSVLKLKISRFISNKNNYFILNVFFFVFFCFFFSGFSTGLVRLYIAGLPLRSCPDHWASF